MKNVCEVLFRSNGRQQSSFKHLLLLAATMGWVLSAPMAFGQELIANGGFESPGGNGANPSSWITIENSFGSYNGAFNGMTARGGFWFLHAGANSQSGGRYQDVTTVPGQSYRLTFWAVGWTGGDPQQIIVQAGTPGPNPNSLALNNNAEYLNVTETVPLYTSPANWTQYTYVFTAAATGTRITFQNYSPGGTSAANIDDVSLVPVKLYPQITAEPGNQWAEVGDNVTMTVGATGVEPLNYQWYFNGNAFTNLEVNSFTLTGLTTNEAGQYYVIVTNLYGAATSSVATLTIPDWGLVINGGFEKNGGNGSAPTGWTKDFNSYGAYTGAAHSRAYGLHPGADSDSGGEYQDLTTVPGNSYSLTLWVQNFAALAGSSHLDVLIGTPGSDPFVFPDAVGTYTTTMSYAAGVSDSSLVVNQNWQKVTLVFTAPGTTTRLGLYNSYKAGDTVHSINIDEVSVFPYTAQPVITNNPAGLTVECGSNVTFSVTAGGATPLYYQWYYNDSPLGGGTAAELVLPDVGTSAAGNYYVVVTNAFGTTTSSVAVLNVMCSGLLTNGGFEFNSGNGIVPAGWNSIINSYGAWSAQPPARPPHNGNWVMHAGNNAGDGGEYQDVATVPGQGYQLTFWSVGWVGGADMQSGKVQIGTPGSNASDLALNNNAEYVNQIFYVPRFDSAANWNLFAYTFVATSAVTRVSFQNLTPSAVNIDDASLVEAIPKPAASIRVTEGWAMIRFDTVVNGWYRVVRSGTLPAVSWSEVSPGWSQGTGSPMEIKTDAGGLQGYFRVEASATKP